MAKIALFLFMALFAMHGFSQKVIVVASFLDRTAPVDNDTIYYDAKRPLTWDDFQGIPDNNHFGGAITSSGFAFNAQMNMENDDVYLAVKIYTFFSKKKSWKKATIHSDYHLAHEQHHFDITRISAQKFYNELVKVKFTAGNYNKLLTDLFNKAFDENNKLQEQYDNETQHSIDSAAQLKWNNRITAEVGKL